ncbi:MAG: phosphoribosylanthranilate isomerase, partial [Sphingobacterium sp.]
STLANIKETIQNHELNAIQLHGEENITLVKALKKENLEIIKVFGIDDQFDWQTINPFLDEVDYLLFDTKSKDFGGTGLSFNWEKLQEYPFDKPYFLSGGISLDNIYEASRFQDRRCIGLDLNSKFELEPGLKDIEKLKKALKIIKP